MVDRVDLLFFYITVFCYAIVRTDGFGILLPQLVSPLQSLARRHAIVVTPIIIICLPSSSIRWKDRRYRDCSFRTIHIVSNDAVTTARNGSRNSSNNMNNKISNKNNSNKNDNITQNEKSPSGDGGGGSSGGGILGGLQNFFSELDAFMDDASARRLGAGAAFYGKRKSNFYGTNDKNKKSNKNIPDPMEDYQGPTSTGLFRWMPDENGQLRPVTRGNRQTIIERNPSFWDRFYEKQQQQQQSNDDDNEQ
jgi:hypothetical protein